ncbi:hypothetical protein [Effusibacillus dendaii]|uniref:Uncharacterized protein n=1 Tax=Effusibacillus dendaii TaxID=2743772 RepID=A0A7I8DFC6_9BACL|nr:hypothetical protein [Effusibacillus dendaii]BCJ87566.1 hypothetical protein skT53_25510 [Effusibacillus dendaii]
MFVNLDEKQVEGKQELAGRDVVYVVIPVNFGGGVQAPDALVLFTGLQNLRDATGYLLVVLLQGFVITAVIMLFIAYGMMRSVTRPLKILQDAEKRLESLVLQSSGTMGEPGLSSGYRLFRTKTDQHNVKKIHGNLLFCKK